jgi:predicted transposase/invertase (TIGR01784 family)
MTKSEQDMYDQDLKRKWDNDLAAASSREKGINQGKIEGRIEGKIEGKLEVALKMKKKGIDPELISECTGISIEEIERL